MNIIKTVRIEKLWGYSRVELLLFPGANFLIGPNGTGKTTIINLVVAALSADFQSLNRIPFSDIEIKLKQVSRVRISTIRLQKSLNPLQGTVSIEYRIRESSRGDWKRYVIEDTQDLRRQRYLLRHPSYYEEIAPDIPSLRKHLKELFNLTWLSIHRAKSFRRQEEEGAYDSTVDSKLMTLADEFVRFFSALSQGASEEMKKFQETVFLSLLEVQSEKALRTAFQRMDFEVEKSQVTDIYHELNIDPKTVNAKLGEHYSALSEAHNHLREDSSSISFKDFAVLATNRKIHRIVQSWNKLTDRQTAIYEPRETFIKIINQLMPTKQFFLNNKSELSVNLNIGNPLKLTDLSSGEKQMLIILGESLLQQKTASVYVADEPELSLHVEWQQSLIGNINRINPNAQILFATHSPDIVGEFSQGVHDVEKVIT